MIFRSNRKLKPLFLVMLAVYSVIFVYGLFSRAVWLVDDGVAIGLLILMYSMSGWLLVGMSGFVMFNVVLLLHVVGAFGLYALRFGFVAYDNVMHFSAMFVVAYLCFNFISRRLHMRNRVSVKRTVVDEHKVVFIFLVLATVSMLGTFVEIVEFTGFLFMEGGQGILVPWDGISGSSARFSNPYVDTLEDIFVNLLGGIVGIVVFYNLRYKKDCWLCRVESQ